MPKIHTILFTGIFSTKPTIFNNIIGQIAIAKNNKTNNPSTPLDLKAFRELF